MIIFPYGPAPHNLIKSEGSIRIEMVVESADEMMRGVQL